MQKKSQSRATRALSVIPRSRKTYSSYATAAMLPTIHTAWVWTIFQPETGTAWNVDMHFSSVTSLGTSPTRRSPAVVVEPHDHSLGTAEATTFELEHASEEPVSKREMLSGRGRGVNLLAVYTTLLRWTWTISMTRTRRWASIVSSNSW